MKVSQLSQLVVGVAIFLFAGASPVLGAAKYRIITEGEFGLKRGNTFFSLKMTHADFEARFGAAEKRTRIADGYRLAYVTEGIAVVITNGAIRSITFVMAPAKTERFEDYQPASAVTTGGIARSSSIDDVIKSEGQPTEKNDDPALGSTNLRYIRGNMEYSFRFKDGVLAQITLIGPRV